MGNKGQIRVVVTVVKKRHIRVVIRMVNKGQCRAVNTVVKRCR